MAGHSLDDKSLRRIGDATRKTELARTRRELHTPPAPTNQTHAARFRMLSPLEQGRQAVGRMLRLERNDDGICYWLATDRQELLHAAAGHQLRWDEGAEVTALWTPAGYSVITNALMAHNGTSQDLVPYGVYSVRHSSSNAPGSIVLAITPNFDGEFLAAWDRDYAFVGEIPDGVPLVSDGLDPGLQKLWPCVTDAHTPTWVAYGTDVGGIPQKILDAFGWADGAHPQRDELWAPGSDARLHRSITTLDQWWWRYTPPAPVCITNPASALGGYWSGLLGYQCDPDDPDAVPPAVLTDPIYWIAPHGWWGWGTGGWPLTGFYNGGYPYWWRGFGFSSYWGAWGPGWWNYRWLGRPPSPDDVPDPDVPVLTVLPVGAALEQLCRYAWVVWQWGYRVLDVDTDRQLALIIGPIRFRNQLVIDTADWANCVPPTTAPPTTAPPTTPPPTTAPPTTPPPNTAPPTTAPPGEAVYSSAGTDSWEAPAGVTTVNVEVWGGGGGGAQNGPGSDGGGGGGGGGYAAISGHSVTPGNSYTVVVGAGGSGGTSTGGSGGQSYFDSTSTCRATGGAGASGRNGGAGGAGTDGDTLHTGGEGGDSNDDPGAGGGGAAGEGGNGSNGADGTSVGGAGGAGNGSGGSGGNGGNTGSSAGSPGSAPGGGGGGGGGSSSAGGAGGVGQVRITW